MHARARTHTHLSMNLSVCLSCHEFFDPLELMYIRLPGSQEDHQAQNGPGMDSSDGEASDGDVDFFIDGVPVTPKGIVKRVGDEVAAANLASASPRAGSRDAACAAAGPGLRGGPVVSTGMQTEVGALNMDDKAGVPRPKASKGVRQRNYSPTAPPSASRMMGSAGRPGWDAGGYGWYTGYAGDGSATSWSGRGRFRDAAEEQPRAMGGGAAPAPPAPLMHMLQVDCEHETL